MHPLIRRPDFCLMVMLGYGYYTICNVWYPCQSYRMEVTVKVLSGLQPKGSCIILTLQQPRPPLPSHCRRQIRCGKYISLFSRQTRWLYLWGRIRGLAPWRSLAVSGARTLALKPQVVAMVCRQSRCCLSWRCLRSFACSSGGLQARYYAPGRPRTQQRAVTCFAHSSSTCHPTVILLPVRVKLLQGQPHEEHGRCISDKFCLAVDRQRHLLHLGN